MNHEVNTFYPEDSGGDRSLLAFHSYMGKKEEKKKEKNNRKLAGVRLASGKRKRNLDIQSSIPPSWACMYNPLCKWHGSTGSKMHV